MQAKNSIRDFKTQKIDSKGTGVYSAKLFHDIDDLILSFDIGEEHFTLMNAQHLICLFNRIQKMVRFAPCK